MRGGGGDGARELVSFMPGEHAVGKVGAGLSPGYRKGDPVGQTLLSGYGPQGPPACWLLRLGPHSIQGSLSNGHLRFSCVLPPSLCRKLPSQMWSSLKARLEVVLWNPHLFAPSKPCSG